jgi:dihydroneopterin aldolase/2-amino-4-hydroxy-6-hydroxymethyldihydropteridine diphosphokinase/dihydropteroate synthase
LPLSHFLPLFQAEKLTFSLQISTTLSPLPLLHLLKSVESTLGRDFSTIRNGPRVIDLDLLLYNEDAVLDTREEDGAQKDDERWLKVPHQGIAEREFVLRPLAECVLLLPLSSPIFETDTNGNRSLAPNLRHPILRQSPLELLSSILSTSVSTVHRVYPLSRSLVEPFSRPSSASPSSRTLIMSIINTTPDSFSDGGVNASLSSALSNASTHLEQGAHILDIGGMSTRPNAADVSPEEEASRVVPLIRALRTGEQGEGRTIPISIDTFRPSVARSAVEAGATIINDVYGGRESGMFSTMAELDVPVVLMHSRGTPETMTSLADYSADGGVVGGVRREMEEMVLQALEKGVRRWNVVLDPGIGFAKTAKQNYELLRSLPELFGKSEVLREFPVLVGLSRKRFLGPEKDAKDRVLETAAGVTASVASGVCEVVRVHDTKEMAEAVRVADAIYRL